MHDAPMARPLRIAYPGAWYHVMNRGARGRAIFRSDRDRHAFLALVADMVATFHVEVHAYCLMGNHYHLLLHTPRGNLSQALRHLNGVYTQRHNRAHGTDGPLFRGRFKAVLVDADTYLAALSRYIHLNPVTAGRVTRPEDYRWSSYPAYVGAVAPPPWLHLQPSLGRFGPRHARQRYQAFVTQGLDDEIRAFYGKGRWSPVLGGKGFRRALARRRKARQRDPEVPDTKRLLPRPSLPTIARATAAHFRVEPASLHRESRGRGNANVPRAVAMTLSRRPGGYPLTQIAQAFKVGNYASVSVAIRRLQERLQEDRALGRMLAALRRSLFGA
jgi:putative transposase